MSAIGLLAIAASLATTPTAAKDGAPVGGWRVFEEGPVDCSLRHDMAQGRAFWLLMRTNGAYRFHVTGLKDDSGKEFRIGVDGRVWRGSYDLSPAETEAIFKGLTSGRQLEIHDGDVVVDRLRLEGSAAAVERLRRCAEDLEARLASEIASGKLVLQPRRTELASFRRPPVRAKAALKGLFTSADYPRWEVEEASEGVTAFSVEVRPDGRSGNCTITSSSGSDVLDIAACRILQTRARYTPGRDAEGEAAADVIRGRVKWVHPGAGETGPRTPEAPPAPGAAEEDGAD